MKSFGRKENFIILEGKTRLPNLVQDMILDFSAALTSIQNSTSSPNQLSLMATIKNYARLDHIIDNSVNNLNKILLSVEQMHQHNDTIDKCIEQVFFF